MTWQAYMLGGVVGEDAKFEEEWAQNRPSVKKRTEKTKPVSEAHQGCIEDLVHPSGACSYPVPPRPLKTKWYHCLTPTEQTYLNKYHELLGAHIQGGMPVCMLGQNPIVHPMHNHGRTNLQTIIRNCHIMWSAVHGRWLFVKELLCAQGFPVYPQASAFGERCSFSFERERRRGTMAEQCGNSMNINAIGASLLWLFSSTSSWRSTGGVAICMEDSEANASKATIDVSSCSTANPSGAVLVAGDNAMFELLRASRANTWRGQSV